MSMTVLTDLIAGNLGGTDLSEIQFGALFAEIGRISSDAKLTDYYFSESNKMLYNTAYVLWCITITQM